MGKGSRQRPVNKGRFAENFDRIFGKKPAKPEPARGTDTTKSVDKKPRDAR